MKIKNNILLCVFALSALTAGFGSCQSEDDALNGLPQGCVPLVLDDVTVAGAQTANNRAAGGSTRAAISENAAGYTGIRKSRFVNGDVLNLTLSNGSGESAVTTSVIATLTGGKWVLTPEKVFITPGVTEISATHTATEQIAGIATDDLAAANADCALTAATGTLSITMKHAGAMIDITPDATDGATITSVTVNTDVPTAAEEEAATGGSGTELHYRTLIATTTTVSSISAVVGGTTYVATLATPLTVAANKRYPVALTFKEQTLSATVSAPQDWTNGGTIKPAGYTYIIDSPEALAQFGWEYGGEAGPDVLALQTADIDMSKLKPAAEAGTNPMTGMPYTYTITAGNWHCIGGMDAGFQGTYNGNGYTISNLKSTDGYGLFYNVVGGTLTGIHLRSVNSQGFAGMGCLAATVENSTISLCSATGTLQSTDTRNNVYIGGLIGLAQTSSITRCSADVDVTTDVSNSNYVCAGGLIGNCGGGTLVDCIATGDVTNNGSNASNATGGLIGSFGNVGTTNNIFGCLATGNVTRISGSVYALLGDVESGAVNVSSCFATGSGYDFSASNAGVTFTDCAYTGTQTSAVSGVTGSVATANLYAILTATNASVANLKTLHWSAADGYTLTEVTNTWYATDVWKDNGTAAPTIDMAYEGRPEPIVAGNTVWKVNGYWVTAPDADVLKGYTWDAANGASGPCANKGNWRVPTMKDFEKMAGWTDTYPWSPGMNAPGNVSDFVTIGSDHTDWFNAFPTSGALWSSELETTTAAWAISLEAPDKAMYMARSREMSSYRVRCVQAQ